MIGVVGDDTHGKGQRTHGFLLIFGKQFIENQVLLFSNLAETSYDFGSTFYI